MIHEIAVDLMLRGFLGAGSGSPVAVGGSASLSPASSVQARSPWQLGCYTRPWDHYDYRVGARRHRRGRVPVRRHHDPQGQDVGHDHTADDHGRGPRDWRQSAEAGSRRSRSTVISAFAAQQSRAIGDFAG